MLPQKSQKKSKSKMKLLFTFIYDSQLGRYYDNDYVTFKDWSVHFSAIKPDSPLYKAIKQYDSRRQSVTVNYSPERKFENVC